jgi:hypothetical protein
VSQVGAVRSRSGATERCRAPPSRRPASAEHP